MYSMLFHISGIAILEIIFFFYYIGPMETFIFKNKVKQLSDEPIGLIPNNTIINDYEYSTYNQTDIVLNELDSQQIDAINEREEKNHQLFIATIQYWGIITASLLILILIINRYRHIKWSDIQQRASSITDEESLELVDVKIEPHLEIKATPDKNKEMCYNITHYVFFGGCIICFQYLFFQNVVMVYDPLSIEEVKYITYTQLYPKLNLDL
jgi:hypothetical protein